MPILSDVKGILFELLLVAAPPRTSDGHSGPQQTDIADSVRIKGSHSSSTPGQLDGYGTGNTLGHRHREKDADSNASTAEATPAQSRGEKSSTGDNICLGIGRDRDSRGFILVGAVALLLSEVVDTWRTMESPLFDYAGNVVGKINLAARVSGVEIRDAQETTEVQGPVENEITYRVKKSTPAAPKKLASSIEQRADSSPEQMAKSREKGYGPPQGSVYATGSLCCNRDHGSCSRGRDPYSASHGYEPCNDGAGHGGLPSSAAAAAAMAEGVTDDEGCSLVMKAKEATPRAVILYRGVRLPFRWFRSSSAGSMETALRETLGKYRCIHDDSTPSPLLYDTGTSNRVVLQPGIPSGRTFLAALDGCLSSPKGNVLDGAGVAETFDETSSPPSGCGVHRAAFGQEQSLFHHRRRCRCRRRERAGIIKPHGQSTSPGPLLYGGTVLNTVPPRRVASDGDLRCPSPAKAAGSRRAYAGVQAKDGVASSGSEITSAIKSGSTDSFARTDDFAQEVEGRQLQLRQGRKEQELRETQRRREAHELSARAVAYQLACRVVCRGHRTRLLVAALWRWKAQASNLKLEQDRREEKRHNDEQAMALLKSLQQKVVSLTASTNESLLAVSVDALERDLIADETTFHRIEADPSVRGVAYCGQDNEIIGQGVTELRAGIARLDKLRMEKAKCQEARLREIHIIREAAARNSTGGLFLPLTTRAELDTKCFEEHAENRGSPTAYDRKNAKFSSARSGEYKQDDHHGAPKPSTWEGKTNSFCREDDANSLDAEGICAGVTVAHRSAEEQRPSRKTRSSGASTREIGDIRNGNGTKSEKESSACVWNKMWATDDEVLEGFLTRHAVDTCTPGGGVERQPHPAADVNGPDRGRAEVGNGALRGSWDLKLLWALFRVFSDSCPPPYTNPRSRSRPASAVRGIIGVEGAFPGSSQRRPESLDFQSADEFRHHSTAQGGMSLLAFLGLCRSARLILPASQGALSCKLGVETAGKESTGSFGRARNGCGYCEDGDGCDLKAIRRECTLEGTNGVTPSTALREKFFVSDGCCCLLDPADAASVFACILRRYGDVTAVVDHSTNRCTPTRKGAVCRPPDHRRVETRCGNLRRTPNDEGIRLYGEAKPSLHRHQRRDPRHQQSDQDNRKNGHTPRRVQHDRPSGSNRSERLGFTLSSSPDKGLLGFGQFVAAVEGVIELLTVGVDGRSCDLCGDAFSAVGVNAGVKAGYDGVGIGAGRDSGDEGAEWVHGGGTRTPRMMTMTPELARIRLVRLAKEVAMEHLAARDRQGSEMLALLDPSLQSSIDINKNVLREIFAFYSHKHARPPHSAYRNHAQPYSRDGSAAAVGRDTRGGRGGDGGFSGRSGVEVDRDPWVMVLGMQFEGVRAFAADFGLAPMVSNAQQLAELWTVACLHQLNQRHGRSNLATLQQVEVPGNSSQAGKEEADDAPPDSDILLFSGFLDFLGLFALRHARTRKGTNRPVGQQELVSFVGGIGLTSPCPSLCHPARGGFSLLGGLETTSA
ncbi:unnamed protein product, partial [Hapterophycus canaliculatus]